MCVYEGIPGIFELSYPFEENPLQSLEPKKQCVILLNYSYRPIDIKQPIQTQPFCIDFVHFDAMEEFMQSIDTELRAARNSVIERIRGEGEKPTRIVQSDR